VAAGV
jgi:hypothetical protein